jgi:hypothetical protein
MSNRVVVSVSVAAVLVALVLSAPSPAPAQTSAAKKAPVPRTAWGKPDLQGVWDFRTITPLERPKDMAGREFLTEAEAAKLEQATEDRNEELLVRPAERAPVGGNVDRRADGTPGFYNNFWLDQGTKTIATRRTSLIIDPPDGRLPALTPAAQKRTAERQQYLKEHPADSWLDRSASDRCIVGFNAGPPLNPGGYNQNLQIFQTPTHVALLTEMVHTVRIVPLEAGARSAGVRQWVGTSHGRWEGDTLVVETSNFKEERGWRNASGNLKLIERFTRVDKDVLEYTYTVTDPETWTRPWTATIPLRLGNLPLYEYACHEGNYSLYNILSGHRAEERAAAKTRP